MLRQGLLQLKALLWGWLGTPSAWCLACYTVHSWDGSLPQGTSCECSWHSAALPSGSKLSVVRSPVPPSTCTSHAVQLNILDILMWHALAILPTPPSVGRMATSKVGSDNVMGSGSAFNERRTSSSLLLDITVTLQHAALRKLIKAAQEAAWRLTGSPQVHVCFLVWLCRLDIAVALQHAHCWKAAQ